MTPWTVRAALATVLLALAISVASDLRERLIKNWVTLPALALVIGLFGAAGGWPLVQMGDVKLMAVCGAAAGFPAAVAVLVLVTVAGGLQAALQLGVARIRGTGRPTHVPYACSIAAGTVAAFLLGNRFP